MPTEVKAATPREDFGCLFSSVFVNSCHRFAEDNAPFAGHHKLPFFFYFFKLLFLLLLFSTGKDFTLSPVPAEDAPTPRLLPGDVPPVQPADAAALITRQPWPTQWLLEMHGAICKAWAELLLALRVSRRDRCDGPAVPQNFPARLRSPWACSAATAWLEKRSSAGSREKGNRGKVF